MGHKLIKRHARWLSAPAGDSTLRPTAPVEGRPVTADRQSMGGRPVTADRQSMGTAASMRTAATTAGTDAPPEDQPAPAAAVVRVLTKVIEMARERRLADVTTVSSPRASKTDVPVTAATPEEETAPTFIPAINLGDQLFNPGEYFSKKQRAEFESAAKKGNATGTKGTGTVRMSFDEIVECAAQLELNLPKDRIRRLTHFLNTFSDNLTQSTDPSGKLKRRNSKVESDGEVLCSDGALYRFVAVVMDASKVKTETAEDVQGLVANGWTETEICELLIQAVPKTAPVEDRNAVLVRILGLGIKYPNLVGAGVTLKQCLDADIELSELRHAGWNSSGAREAGVDLRALLACGFTLRELMDVQKLACIHDWHLLREAGASVAQMRACGIPVYELKLAGYSGTQLIEGGVSPRIVEQTRRHLTSVVATATEEAGTALEQLGPSGPRKARALLEAAQALVLHPHAARLFPADFNGNSVWAAVKGTSRLPDTPLHATVRIREEWQLVSTNYKALLAQKEDPAKKKGTGKGSKAKGASDKKGKAEKQQSKKLDKEGAKDQ